MMRGQLVPIFSRRWMIDRAAFVSVALLCLLAAPLRSPAQDAGVSGIPPGPGNARGLNGSTTDPRGSGKAAKTPATTPPAISPGPIPALAPPTAGYRTVREQGVDKMRRTRQPGRSRTSATRAAVREQD